MKKSNNNRSAIIALLLKDDSQRIKALHSWSKYEAEILKCIKHCGKTHALSRYKDSYKFLRNHILKLDTLPIPYCKTDKRGIPKTLWSLRPFIKGDRNSQRLALTIARSYELIKLPIDYDTKNIEDTAIISAELQEVAKDFKLFLTKFVNTYPWYLGSLQLRSVNEPRVFTTLSSGPNGPAVMSSHLDARAVLDDGRLFESIRDLNSQLNQSWITEWLWNHASYTKSNPSYLTGRLGFSSEPGGKTRVFAIADYWSQTSLKVIQDSLYNTLKSISTDSTRDQDRGFKSLIKESLGKETYCFDLSSASDKIPAFMQVYRIELMGGKKLGEAWLKVMTDRDFYIKDQKRFVRWGIGQPLGLLSSFPSFALWHHDIIQYAANIENIQAKKKLKFFKYYRLLGDDVVIFDKRVARNYQNLLKIIGIPINLDKSVLGSQTHSQIEFTKRFALDGMEMSSIKYNISQKSGLKYTLDLVDLLYERDFIGTDSGHYDLPFLCSKSQESLRFFLWVRLGLNDPKYHNNFSHYDKVGNHSYSIARESFVNKLLETRAQMLRNKTLDLDRLFDANKDLATLFESNAVPYNATALGLKEYQTDNLMLHPLVWSINQTGLDLTDILSCLWDELPSDVAPVEYLPIVSNSSYFTKPKKATKEFLSKLIQDVHNELKDKALIQRNTPLEFPLMVV